MKLKKAFAPQINLRAAEQYGEANRAWQGVPSIARTKGGRLFLGFMSGGIYEPDPRNCCLAVYSDDGGETWSEPVFAIESMPEQLIRCFEIEFWVDPKGALWIFWVQVPYPAGLALPNYEQKIDMENDSEYHRLEAQSVTWCAVCTDPDGEELEFSAPRPLFNAVIRNHPFAVGERWFFPAYITSLRDHFEFYYTDDGAQTFQTVRIPGRLPGRHYDEPCFYQMPDGRLAAVVRTTSPECYRMISADGGESWSEPEPFMATSSQRPCCGNGIEKGVWMITSIHRKNRNGLRLMYSQDGQSFVDRLILDDRERVSYPEFVQDEKGTMYVVYDRERNNKIRKSRVTGRSEAAKEILFARIPAEALRSGEITPATVRARVITKARINELENRFTGGQS